MKEELIYDLISKLDVPETKIDKLTLQLEIGDRQAFNSVQAANYLSISAYTMRELARTGGIDFVKNGRNYIFRRRHLDEWLNKQERR